jgi:hypothetical protein
MRKQEPIVGRTNIPLVYRAEVTWFESDIAYWACYKTEIQAFVDIANCKRSKGKTHRDSEKGASGIPIVVMRPSVRMTLTKKEVTIRGSEVPLVIFGLIDDLPDNAVVLCIVTRNADISAFSKEQPIGVAESVVKYGTMYERLQLTTYWTELEVLSEPFVTNESWGYCPVVHVRTRLGESKYLQVSARSIRDLLESFRHSDSGLVGMKIRLRKKTAAQASGFEGFRIADFSN